MSDTKLLHGDCLDLMKSLDDETIDLTVTSPPYDNLRTYNGYTFDFEGIAQELYRVTKKGGVVVWVVGDATIKGSETGTSFRQALYFMEFGFNLHDTMIYQKLGGGAKGSNYCYWQQFEYMFVFSKGKPKSLNLIHDKKNEWFGTKAGKLAGRNVDGSIKKDRSHVSKDVKEFSKRGNVWIVDSGFMKSTSDKIAYKHPAIFPESLAKDHIISWSNEGDTVLDCFLGSGTTGKMAVLLNRKFIGIEISQEYLEIAQKRINDAENNRGLF